MNDKKLSFAVQNVELLKENEESNFSLLSLDFFASGPNLHDMFVSETTLSKTADTIKNCPVVWKYSPLFDDATTHTQDQVPVGFIPEKENIESIKLSDGRVMLRTIAFVWKKYCGQILDIFKRDSNEKPISVEMSVFETEERPDGLLELLDYRFDAVTILGSLVRSAIPLARATVLQFAKEYDEDLKKEFFATYDHIDMKIPSSVKKNAEIGLSLYKDSGKNATSVALSVARHLIKNETASHEKVRHIAKMLKSKKFMNMQKDSKDESFLTYMLYGGDEGRNWSGKVESELDDADSKKLSYFNFESKIENGGKENIIVDELEEKKEEMAVEPEKDEEKEEQKEEQEEQKEEKSEQKEEKTEEKMSLNAWVDIKAVLAMLADETESYGKVAEEFAKEPEQMNYGMVMKCMYEKMCKMAEMCGKFAEVEEKNKAYMAENEELKKFKADVEDRQFKYEVDACMSEIKCSVEIPQEDFDNLVEESKKFSLETIDAFKNLARSRAFSFAVKSKKPEDNIKKYGFPWGSNSKPEKKSIWS